MKWNALRSSWNWCTTMNGCMKARISGKCVKYKTTNGSLLRYVRRQTKGPVLMSTFLFFQGNATFLSSEPTPFNRREFNIDVVPSSTFLFFSHNHFIGSQPGQSVVSFFVKHLVAAPWNGSTPSHDPSNETVEVWALKIEYRTSGKSAEKEGHDSLR